MRSASDEFSGHSLALTLLGSYREIYIPRIQRGMPALRLKCLEQHGPLLAHAYRLALSLVRFLLRLVAWAQAVFAKYFFALRSCFPIPAVLHFGRR